MRPETDGQSVPPEERRQSTRYKLKDAQAIMSWDEGAEQVSSVGEVVNISGGGVALLAERAPAPGISVWLQLTRSPAAMERLEARLLELSVEPSGRHLVRLRFTHWVSLDAILELHHERRLWQRFPVRETRAKLTWFEDRSERSSRGELMNLGGGGAAIIVDVNLPVDACIWFELESDARTQHSVESRLVVISLDPCGSKIARIKFIDPCPIDLFELAIHGSC